MGEAGTCVAGGIDSVAGGAAEGESNGPDEQGDGQGAERAQVNGDDAAGEGFFESAFHGEHSEDEDEGTDDFTEEIRGRTANGRGGAKDGALEFAVRGLLPVRQIGQPDQDRSGEGPEQLGENVAGHSGPRESAHHGERYRDGGIEVRSADAGHGRDGDENGQGPAGGDDDPTGVLTLGFGQQHIGHDAVAEHNEEHRAEEFTGQRRHKSWVSRTGRSVEQEKAGPSWHDG